MKFAMREYWTRKSDGQTDSFLSHESATLSQVLRHIVATVVRNEKCYYNNGSRQIKFVVTNESGKIVATIRQA